MLRVVIRRLTGNRWKAISLLAGLVLAVAIAFCIPVYANGILQRVFQKNMAESQLKTGIMPGYLTFEYQMSSRTKDSAAMVSTVENLFASKEHIDLPVLTGGRIYRFEMFDRVIDPRTKRYERLVFNYVENLEEHVNVTVGRMYDPNRDDGVLEVVANKKFLVRSKVVMNEITEFDSMFPDEEGIKIMVVGMVEPKDNHDPFWHMNLDTSLGTIYCGKEYFERRIAAEPPFSRHFTVSFWYRAYDYMAIDTDNVDLLIEGISSQRRAILNATGTDKITFSGESVLAEFQTLRRQVMVNLYMLVVPIFIILGYYVIMVANLKLQSEQSEIALLKSRGAGRRHIIRLYGIESLLLAGTALLAGPPLGLVIVRMIGASNGFLTFVNRTALPLVVKPVAVIMAISAALLFVVIMMLPAVLGIGGNILDTKRKKNRLKRPFWQRYFLDFLFLGLAAYSFYSMEMTRRLAQATGLAATTQNTDFLLYGASTLFALGAGMLFLRIYPYIVWAIFAVGRQIWPAGIYASLNRIARNRDYSGVMLFLILTLSVGLFSADAAHSINTHIENNVYYSVGADAQYMPRWKHYDYNGKEVFGRLDETGGKVIMEDEGVVIQSVQVRFYELFPEALIKLPEVESAARVYSQSSVNVRLGSYIDRDNFFMAIDPYEFGKTISPVWDQNAYHINEYLNSMMSYPEGVIVSRGLMDAMRLKIGDEINIATMPGILKGKVIAVVDSWPGYSSFTVNSKGKVIPQDLVVANMGALFAENPVRPYHFWIRKADGVSDIELYEALKNSDFGLTSISSAADRMIGEKNDPVLQGTNGMLSVAFLVSVAICAMGFMIYWIISIKSRTLQFGISRALGMRKGGILSMLVAEQLLVSGMATVAGVFIGKLGSLFFVPLLALQYSLPDQTVAFRMLSSSKDLLTVLAIMVGMLLVCFTILSVMAIHLKIDRAVKLGEE
ncbi:MAG TPA: ABC transporter permease [Clostridiales bacterium]|nr:ABC transporter permease [Clostridiales bacterium]